MTSLPLWGYDRSANRLTWVHRKVAFQKIRCFIKQTRDIGQLVLSIIESIKDMYIRNPFSSLTICNYYLLSENNSVALVLKRNTETHINQAVFNRPFIFCNGHYKETRFCCKNVKSSFPVVERRVTLNYKQGKLRRPGG